MDVLPSAGDKFYTYFMTFRPLKIRGTLIRQPYLFFVQHFCSQCEDGEDVVDCVRCRKRKHSFWDDPFGVMLTYLCEPQPWANNMVAIAHNAKAFDLHFIMNRAILLKWKPGLIMNGLKIMCMKMEHFVFF